MNLIRKISTVATVFLLLTLVYSCKDDDVDCDRLGEQLLDLEDDYYEAYYDDEDCDELEDLYTLIIKKLREGKNCNNIEEEIDNRGYDSVDEYIDYLEDQHDDFQDNLDC